MKYNIYYDLVGVAWPFGIALFYIIIDPTLIFGICMGMIFGMIAGMRLHNIIINKG